MLCMYVNMHCIAIAAIAAPASQSGSHLLPGFKRGCQEPNMHQAGNLYVSKQSASQQTGTHAGKQANKQAGTQEKLLSQLLPSLLLSRIR